MNDAVQEALFEDPIGLRFRHARERARWTLETVAQKLRLPVAVLEAIEIEDWARLGAPIFVRSYVGSYARLLGLPADLADEVIRGRAAPQLQTIGSSGSSRRALGRGAINLAYLALTLLVVGAVVLLAMYYQSPGRGAMAFPEAPSALQGRADAARFTVSSDGSIRPSMAN